MLILIIRFWHNIWISCSHCKCIMLCPDATETRLDVQQRLVWFVVPMMRIRNFHADVCLSACLSVYWSIWQCVSAPLFVCWACMCCQLLSAPLLSRLACGASAPLALPGQAAIVLNFLTAIIIRQLAECSIMQLCEAAVTIFDCTRQTSNCH